MNQSWRRLRSELQTYVALRGRSTVQLAEFLHEQAIQLDELYRSQGRSGWTALRRDAELLSSPEGQEDEYFGHRFSDLLHCNDPEQVDLLVRIGESSVRYHTAGDRERCRLQMLAYQIDGQHHQVGSGEDFLARLSRTPEISAELGELGAILQARNSLRFRAIPGLTEVPLCLHASYGIREILTAVGWLTAKRRTPFQSGVLALPNRRVELLFVTLDKSEGFHDRIAYRDYAISTERFHWQSQNSAGPDTPAGRRYLESPDNGWSFQLFIRRRKGDPYQTCGPVSVEMAEGEKPMSIEWRLEVPLPIRLYQEFNILRGQ